MVAAGVLSACSGGSGAPDHDGTEARGTTAFEDETEADDQLPPKLPITATVEVPPEPDPSFPGCVSITSRRAGLGLGTSVLLWTYDPSRRVLAAVPSDEHGSSVDSVDPNQSRALFWRLDMTGRVAIRAGGGSGYRPFRQAVTRDDHGNVIAIRAAYVDAIDVLGNLEGQSYSEAAFSNDYNDDGQLVMHSVLDEVGATLATNRYTHDAAGRCDTVTTVGEAEHVERREYDSAGRLWHQYIESEVGAPDDPRAERGNSVVTFQYDELGRLRSTRVAGPDDLPITAFGVDYRSDGSFVVEQNWLSDTDDTFSRTVWSPACNELRGLLTPDRNGPCSADYVLVGDIAF